MYLLDMHVAMEATMPCADIIRHAQSAAVERRRYTAGIRETYDDAFHIDSWSSDDDQAM